MKRFLLSLAFIATAFGAQGDITAFSWADFAQISVVQDGRVKPLDSFARVMLKRMTGETSYEGRSPCQWLAGLLFTPREAMREPMLQVRSAQASAMLGLTPRADRHYSFAEVAAVLPAHGALIESLSHREKDRLSRDEEDVAHLVNATNDFAELIGSFSLILPLEMDEAAHLQGIEGVSLSYLDLSKSRQSLKGRLSERVMLQEKLDQDNALLRIIPPFWQANEWLSPWGVLKASQGSPQSAALLRDWRRLALSYRSGNVREWDETAHKLLMNSLGVLGGSAGLRLWLEVVYNRLNLLPWAMACYALGLFLLLLPKGHGGGKTVLLFGACLQATALMMRMLILMRPPVGTLYESLIFVSFVVLALGGWLSRVYDSRATLPAAAASALLLLFASEVFAGEGDTLGVLTAVLNTNFWLATHVICITVGYGCALVTGAIAHIYLYRRVVKSQASAELVALQTLMHRAALVALLFTAVGTMLGGIWADQSWGRFWGWDPKENGALLIVLWLTWLLHGRVAGQLKPFVFALLTALLNVVVAVAWVGVNLLSVGLHSYGFTDTAASGLLGFCLAEFLFTGLMAALMLARRRRAEGNRLAC